MANLKYKDNETGQWQSILLTRGATGPQGPAGKDAEISLNGASVNETSIYAPTNAGQSGQFLMSNGVNQAPSFVDVPPSTDTINNLTTSTFTENQALSAYQGYILNQNKVDKSTTVAGWSLASNVTAAQISESLGLGELRESYFENVTAKANSLLTSLVLSPGVWVISGHVQYQGQNKRWYLSITNAGIQMGAYDNSGWIDGMVTGIIAPAVQTTYELRAWFMTPDNQASETLCHNGYLKAVRIK